ncbi:MAG: hypothetical protein J5927_07300 [Oscillospiraceae bacterium]|nr:hypothetical protein [Oscillospiraceae bacterium]
MAEKAFAGLRGPVNDAAVRADYEAAETFDKVKVGALGAYFRDGFKIRFLAYDALERVFIRIQEVNGRMCCGNATFAYYRLVFVKDGKEVANALSENEKAMDDALAAIAARAPALAIGVA